MHSTPPSGPPHFIPGHSGYRQSQIIEKNANNVPAKQKDSEICNFDNARFQLKPAHGKLVTAQYSD